MPVITTGRLASRMNPQEQAALKHTLQSHAPTPAWLTQATQTELEVELGIGNGLAIINRAQNNPNASFLGCEIYLNGLEVLHNQLQTQPQSNLKILNQDARELLQTLPKQSATRILMLFPDPWPKARHHKRRLLQPELLTLIAQTLKPNGEFWVVTDWPDYAFHTISLLQNNPHFTFPQTALAAAACKVKVNSQSPINTQQTLGPQHLATPPSWWIPTKYQQKAAKVGRLPWFIQVQKHLAT